MFAAEEDILDLLQELVQLLRQIVSQSLSIVEDRRYDNKEYDPEHCRHYSQQDEQCYTRTGMPFSESDLLNAAHHRRESDCGKNAYVDQQGGVPKDPKDVENQPHHERKHDVCPACLVGAGHPSVMPYGCKGRLFGAPVV